MKEHGQPSKIIYQETGDIQVRQSDTGVIIRQENKGSLPDTIALDREHLPGFIAFLNALNISGDQYEP